MNIPTNGMNINNPQKPLFPKSWQRLVIFARLIQMAGMSIKSVKIITPFGMSSSHAFAGRHNKLIQIFVSQYVDLRFLPLNENSDFQKESLLALLLVSVGCDTGDGCVGLATEAEDLSLDFDKSNFLT